MPMSVGMLQPALPFPISTQGHHADTDGVWVGSLDVSDVEFSQDLRLEGGGRFAKARLLIWESDRVQGFVEINVTLGRIKANDLSSALESLRRREHKESIRPLLPMSIVVCTRDRPNELRSCLTALLGLEHPQFEIIVVDNAPTTDATRYIVESMSNKGVRYLRVAAPGLSRARNAGVRAAIYGHVAFTDDDVVVDRRWLGALCQGFAVDHDIGCVTGLVATGQLESRSQRYFDHRAAWAGNTEVTMFRLGDPPAGVPLFPFQFGAYGTGANFAAKRSLLFDLGGFDEALGIGSPTGGGEDIDWFVRVVLKGHALLYQPDAVAWHNHRIDDEGLSTQLENYGLGLGAVLAKLATNPKARRAMAPLLIPALVHTLRMLKVQGTTAEMVGPGNAMREFRAMLKGPWALHRARQSRLPRPLHPLAGSRGTSWT
jgi:GT2 family glycosyltransferase